MRSNNLAQRVTWDRPPTFLLVPCFASYVRAAWDRPPTFLWVPCFASFHASTHAALDRHISLTFQYSSSLARVTFVLFFWQGRLVHMPMNTASRGLSVHSKRPHLSGCVSTGNTLSFFIIRLRSNKTAVSVVSRLYHSPHSSPRAS